MKGSFQALSAHAKTAYFNRHPKWGSQWPPPNNAGNYFGEECATYQGQAALRKAKYDEAWLGVIESFNDREVFTAPVGSYRANGLGIYDLGGNVWEWCEDEYERLGRVLRGGSWSDANPELLLSSYRNFYGPDVCNDRTGFRCVAE